MNMPWFVGLIEVETEISCRGGVCECSDGDAIHAGFGDGANIVEGDASGGFEKDARLSHGDGLGEQWRGHVIEEEDVHSIEPESFRQLIQCVHLDLDTQSLGLGAADAFLQGRNSARSRKVVVFDEDHIAEAHPVVCSASGANSGFFKFAKARSCFARVENPGLGSRDGIHVRAGQRGNPAEPLEKVQRGSFCGHQGFGRASQTQNRILLGDPGPLRQKARSLDLIAHAPKNLDGGRSAGQHAGLPRDDAGGDRPAPEREIPGGGIAGAEVFGEREADDVLAEAGGLHD